MDRYKSTKVASIFGIIGNLFLLIIKVIVSLFTHSQSLMGDTLNSAGDILSSIMTFIGNKIASKEADEDHNLGHGKAEYIFSLLISVSMIVVAIRLLYTSSISLFIKSTIIYSNWLIIVCLVTILTKFSLFIYTNKLAKKFNNLLIRANSKDHRNDCILTSLVLISAISSKFGYNFIDGIMGIIVAGWICYVGIKIFEESFNVLMDKGMNDELKGKVLNIINSHKEIIKIEHLNSTPVGYQYQISLSIFVDGKLSTFKSHEIADKLEEELSSLDDVYLAIIHVNPLKVKKGVKKK